MSGSRARAERRREGRAAAKLNRSPATALSGPFWGRHLGILLPVLLICVTLYAYHDSLDGPFIFDDVEILTNPTIRQLSNLQQVLSPPPRSSVEGRPIANLSLALNYAFNGLGVRGFHVFNLGVHVLVALALYGVLRRTLAGPRLRDRFGEDARWLALAAAVLWSVHPLGTEAVDYVLQRTESLMALFLLVTLYCVIRGAEAERPLPWYLAAVIANAAGMGTKEVMAVAPVVIVAYDWLFLSVSWRDVFRRRWRLHLGLAAGWLVFAALVGQRMRTDVSRLRGTADAWLYLKTQAGVIVHYLRLSFWPHPLAADYDDWPLATSLVSVLPSAAVVMGLLGITVWALYRRKPVAFLGVFFFGVLAPTSSVWPLVTEVAAERRMYLPLAALAALFVLVAHVALKLLAGRLGWPSVARHAVAAALLVVMVATLAQVTLRRNLVYQNTEVFWADVLAKRPTNARAHGNLGDHLFHQGRIDEAKSHFSRALELRPDMLSARYNLGATLDRSGQLDAAVEQYREVLRSDPGDARSHIALGSALSRQGKSEEAVAHYLESLRLHPDNFVVRLAMATELEKQGRIGDAVQQYSGALRLNPSNADAHTRLGIALTRLGRLSEAGPHFAEALRIAPTAAHAFNMGMALVSEGRSKEAVRHLQLALTLDPRFEQARLALASLAR